MWVVTSAGHEWATITLSMIGKFGISAAFAIIYVFSAELFPTMMVMLMVIMISPGLCSAWCTTGWA